MSLDVHLSMPNKREPVPGGTRIYIRREGRTEEISRREWDELYPDRPPVSVFLPDDDESGEVFWRNITHNLGQMAKESGLYDAMWRPEEQGWTHARDLIAPLRDGLAELQSDPARFKEFDPGNGWGSYDGLLNFAAAYLAACMKWPDAKVMASR